jgi:hypothetical protein
MTPTLLQSPKTSNVKKSLLENIKKICILCLPKEKWPLKI